MFEKNVDQIMAVFTKTIDALEARADACFIKETKALEEMTAAKKRADEAGKEADRAMSLATKLSDLLN